MGTALSANGSTSDWNESLDRLRALIQEIVSMLEGSLRFRARFVSASELAGQYYCEKKVELTRLHGEEGSPEMLFGRQAHVELLSDTVRTTREELWRRIFAGEPVAVRELLLAAKHREVPLVGVTDLVVFARGLPVALFEHKFSRAGLPFNDYHVQAQVYCYMLQKLGFDISLLKYILVMVPPECRGREELVRIPKLVLQNLDQTFLTMDVPPHKVRMYIYPYAEDKLLRDLEWALDYWKEGRDAKPTTKAAKCRVCAFRTTCEFSLAKTP